MSQPDVARIDVELTRLIRRVRARAMSELSAIHPNLDYGPFLFLLRICDAPEGIRGSELAESLAVHKSTASRAVAALGRMGLVRRLPDPDDGRAQLLVAEPEARDRVNAFRTSAHQRIMATVDGWSDGDVARFGDLLTRYNDTADEVW